MEPSPRNKLEMRQLKGMNEKGQNPARRLDNRKVAGSRNQPLHCNKGENSESVMTTRHLALQGVSLQPSNKQQPGRDRSPCHSIFTATNTSWVNKRKKLISGNLVVFLRFC